jgi:AsmA-like C-terminal region
MVRKLLIIVGSAVLLLALLTYGFLAGLFLQSARDSAVQAAVRSVSDSLQGTLEVGALRGSFLSALVLQNVVLKDAHGTVIGQIDEIRVSYDLLGLMRRRLTVRAIEIIGPRLTIIEEPDGVLNISRAVSPVQPRAPAEAKEPFGLPVGIIVERLQLRDGEVALGLSTLPGVRQVQGLQMRLQAQLDQQGMQARVQELTAHTTPAQVDLHTLQGAVQAVNGVMRVDGLRLEMGRTVLTADGVLPNKQQPANFALQIDPLDVAEIGRLLQNDALHGGLRLGMKVEGPPEALVASAQLSPTGAGDVRTIALQGEANMLAAPLRYRAQVDITHLDLTAFLNKAAWQSDVNLQVRLAGEGLAPHELRSEVQVEILPSHLGNITLQPSQIDLQAQQGRFQIRRFDVETSMAHMQATGAIDLAGRSDLQYELTATLDNLRQLLEQEQLNGSVRLQGQASGDWPNLKAHGELDVHAVRYQNYALETLHLTYEGSQLGAQPDVMIQLILRQAHLGEFPVELVKVAGKYSGGARQLSFEVSVDQSRDLAVATQGMLTLHETGQQVNIETLRLQLADRLWQTAAPVQVRAEPGHLQFTPLRLAHGEESLEISGGLSGEQLQDIRLQATQINLAPLQRLVNLPEPMNGRVTLQVQLTGTLPEPRLHTELAVHPTGPGDPPFRQLQASFSYAERQLQGDVRLQQGERDALTVDLQLPIDLAFTALTTDQRLIEGPMALEVRLERPNLAVLPRWHGGLPKLAGTLQGMIGVQGTYAQLGLKSELKLEELGIEGIVERLKGAIDLTAKLVAAPSVEELKRALRQGDLTVKADQLALQIPVLQGRLPAREGPPQPFDVRDFVLQAEGQRGPQGIQAALHTLRLQASGFGVPRTEVHIAATV